MVRKYSPQVQGQAALILIMIMSVVGAVTVSVASQSVENLRTQEIETTSSQSFRAAESALEVALKDKASVTTTQLPGGAGNYSATYDSAEGSSGFVAYDVVEGDVVETSLVGAAAVTGLNIYWNSDSAVFVSILSGSAASGYSVQYYAADPDNVRAINNKFETTAGSPIPLIYTSGSYTFRTVTFGNKLTVPINLLAAKTPISVRIRLLYSKSSVGVEPVGGTLAGQIVSVKATGTAQNNIVTNLSFSKFSERVPEIFDNVLYTNLNLTQ